MAKYLERNETLPPLNKLEYRFISNLYRYLTRQESGDDFRRQLYDDYIKLINICYFPNREDISQEWIDVIYTQCNILIDRDYLGPWTFIILNNSSHYRKIKQVLELIKNWSENPLYYGYAAMNEFFIVLDFLRKRFDSDKINIQDEVGKWPRQLRKRKGRKW
jgi:hypothetical protein